MRVLTMGNCCSHSQNGRRARRDRQEKGLEAGGLMMEAIVVGEEVVAVDVVAVEDKVKQPRMAEANVTRVT